MAASPKRPTSSHWDSQSWSWLVTLTCPQVKINDFDISLCFYFSFELLFKAAICGRVCGTLAPGLSARDI